MYVGDIGDILTFLQAKMEWPTWMRHYGSKAGTKTLSVLEGMGGTAAYYLGITTPKYQSEIDEYNRMVAKQKSQEEELVSWSTGPHAQTTEPVVEDIKKDPSQAMETMEKWSFLDFHPQERINHIFLLNT